MIVKRILEGDIKASLKSNPVTAIIGARQVGKSTLAKRIITYHTDSVYLDLERPSDIAKLQNAEGFFMLHRKKLICIDEIQHLPNIFKVIRSVVDDDTFTGRFLILGSASPELLRQTAESLAGRIAYFKLAPFSLLELGNSTSQENYHLRGGFPRAIKALSDESASEWLENFRLTFLERDLRVFGFNIPPQRLNRLWTMIAHLNGQLLNLTQLGTSMGLDQKTIRHHIEVLQNTFMLRLLEPYYVNTKKRLIKTPKIYLTDTGILNSLLQITDYETLYSHPSYGSSWELLVIEQICQVYKKWKAYFFRTSAGAELDLVLVRATKKIAIEIKASTAPKVSRGFWSSLETIKPDESYVIAQVDEAYPIAKNVWVYPLLDFLLEKTTKATLT